MTRQQVLENREKVLALKANGKSREEIAQAMGFTCGICEVIAYELDLILSDDTPELDKAIEELVTTYPKPLQDYRAGKKAALGAVIGMVKKNHPSFDARQIQERLLARVAQLDSAGLS